MDGYVLTRHVVECKDEPMNHMMLLLFARPMHWGCLCANNSVPTERQDLSLIPLLQS